jgi:hypothetical protein
MPSYFQTNIGMTELLTGQAVNGLSKSHHAVEVRGSWGMGFACDTKSTYLCQLIVNTINEWQISVRWINSYHLRKWYLSVASTSVTLTFEPATWFFCRIPNHVIIHVLAKVFPKIIQEWTNYYPNTNVRLVFVLLKPHIKTLDQ